MLAKYLFLILLPAFVYSRIDIKIKLVDNEYAVNMEGEQRDIISVQEQDTFELDSDTLIKVIQEENQCKDVYLKPPTPHGDVYDKYSWAVPNRIIKPVQARVLGMRTELVEISAANYINNHDNAKVSYEVNITQAVKETFSHTWSHEGQLSVEQSFNYEVILGEKTADEVSSFIYTSGWNENTIKERKIILESASSLKIYVPPGAKTIASLIAIKGTVDIEVVYEATVEGYVICNSGDENDDYKYRVYDLPGLQDAGDLPKVKRSTERLSIDFYTDVRIKITNFMNEKIIEEDYAGAIILRKEDA